MTRWIHMEVSVFPGISGYPNSGWGNGKSQSCIYSNVNIYKVWVYSSWLHISMSLCWYMLAISAIIVRVFPDPTACALARSRQLFQ